MSTLIRSTSEPKPSAPRKLFIQKSDTGFGFNVRGQVSEGGPLKLYNGEFYAPLQQVSAVLKGGAADKAGLCRGDRILEVNGTNVDGATHKQVVDLIKSGGDNLTLTVISVPNDPEYTSKRSTDNLNSDDSSTHSNDYSERRPISITIPDHTELKSSNGDRYTVFNIYLSNKFLCSRRFKEFDVFASLLKREFRDFIFPSLPSKWPFRLSDKQLDQRRRDLETYLDKISSVRCIFESDIVRQFLCLNDPVEKFDKPSEMPINLVKNGQNVKNNRLYENSDSEDTEPANRISKIDTANKLDLVKFNILLPNRKICSINIHRNANTDHVYKNLIEFINLDVQLSCFFYLFEIIDQYFGKQYFLFIYFNEY